MITMIIIPSLHYGCETWIPTESDKQNLLNIQLSIIRKIIKVPKSTQKMSLYGEIGELPIDIIYNRQKANLVS